MPVEKRICVIFQGQGGQEEGMGERKNCSNGDMNWCLLNFTFGSFSDKMSHNIMAGGETLDPYNLNTLQPQIERLGYLFQYTPQTPTTMRLAENHIRSGGVIPAVFLTDHQTQGIGREGRVWTDTQGKSILVSVGMQIEEATTPIFSDLVALVTCQALRGNGAVGARIKYPNDLVADDKKTGGMLVINVYDGTEHLGVNIGIGINVHYAEEEVRNYGRDYPATALAVYNPNIRRQTLLVEILQSLRNLPTKAHILALNPHYRQTFDDLWREYSSILGREIQVESGEDIVVKGQVVDTRIGGGILVKDDLSSKWFNRFNTTMKVRLVN